MDENFFKMINIKNIINLKERIINKETVLTEKDMYSILSLEDEESLKNLFFLSSEIKKHFFSNKLFLYSFIYFSTYCKNNCSFCNYCSKNNIKRYRLSFEELSHICTTIKNKSIHMIDLTMGEDMYFYENEDILINYIKISKKITNLDIMLSPGVIDKRLLPKIKDAGTLFFALYQETYNRKLFTTLRQNQSFDKRNNLRTLAKKNGFLVEDGILTGICENEHDEKNMIIESIKEMKKQNLDQLRVMTFEPQKGTKFENKKQKSELIELKTIALLRLLFPDILIPASLDINGIEGMKKRIFAGANVVTSIIQQDSKLDGVVNFDKNIKYDERKRDIDTVIKALNTLNMIPATISDFKNYIHGREKNENKKCI